VYQRLDTSIEEVLVYRGATIPVSIRLSLQLNLYCWKLLDTAWQQRKSTSGLKLVKHIVNIYF